MKTLRTYFKHFSILVGLSLLGLALLGGIVTLSTMLASAVGSPSLVAPITAVIIVCAIGAAIVTKDELSNR